MDAPPQITVFTRLPRAGHAKTRLIPALGAQGAAELHRRLTEHTLTTILPWVDTGNASLQIRFAGGDLADMQAWLDPLLRGSLIDLVDQGEGDLGDKMNRVLQDSAAAGVASTVIIGTDAPGMLTAHLDQALDALHSETKDVVLGPATDGGYYLIGLRAPAPQLMHDMPWGTDRVLPITLARCREQGLNVAQLPPLPDIDRPQDLHWLTGFADLAAFAKVFVA